MASEEGRDLPATNGDDVPPELAGYGELLEDLKARIRQAQVRATLAVNRELVLLYWQIGRKILARQAEEGWGSKVIDRLSGDLRRTFPDVSGFSARNLKYMRAFAEAWPNEPFVQQPVAQIPWGHNIVLLDKAEGPQERLWYTQQIIEHGWSRNVLVHQIESGLYERQGEAVTNFEDALPPPQSDLASELLKDPYHFDFLELGPEKNERELEHALLAHLREFFLELGVGFSLVGNQYRLEVSGKDYRLDLLFYHLRLRCFIVVELKIGDFRPEYAGKMNFYLGAVDDQVRRKEDHASIGLILCKDRDRVVVEYALHEMGRPIGVAEYRLTEQLPEDMRDSLPSPEALERELGEPDNSGE